MKWQALPNHIRVAQNKTKGALNALYGAVLVRFPPLFKSVYVAA